jgi:hypothetical protein
MILARCYPAAVARILVAARSVVCATRIVTVQAPERRARRLEPFPTGPGAGLTHVQRTARFRRDEHPSSSCAN